MDLPDLIAERFELERLAGSGGMGQVYRALDRLTGEAVAVKILHSESVEAARFEREGAVLAELRHPGIVRYVAHGRTEHGAYLAMEWLEGEDLSQRVRRGELALDEVVTLGGRVAEALHEAHRRGVVHRDVKPGNIFLVGGSVDRVKLVDFGVARAPDGGAALTRTGYMVGTPAFMSPEQARGERDVDGRADLFALGVVLYRLIGGRPPFAGDDVLGLLIKVALEEAPRLRELRPDTPEALDDLLARMLAKLPAGRPADAAAVAAELSRIRVGPGSARPSAPATPRSVTRSEQRLLCVLVARAAGDDAAPTRVAHPDSPEVDLAGLAARHGGKLHALVDGSLFVTLGGPEAPTDLAVRAARCALTMRRALPGLPMALVAGRAVLSGRVPVGEAIDRGVAMLAAGDATGEVRLDGVIAGLLDARFDVRGEPAGPVLLAERDLAEGSRMLLGKPTACLGRDAELLRLASHLEECLAEPMARAVLVTAPAGMGKSRLRHEFARQARLRRADVEVWVGRGDLMSAGSPFAMLGSAIRRAAGVRSGEPLAARQQKILARVGRHLAEPELSQVAPFIGEIAGVPFADERGEHRASRGLALGLGDQMLRAFLDWLRAETAGQPLLLVLEDLHWGDLPSVAFVGAALRDLAELPLLVLALARPEVHETFPRLWADRPFAEVKLAPLSRKAAEKLVRRALPGATPAVVEALVGRGGGNAFYLEELIRAVAEGRDDTLPETVLAMAQSRLDGLDPEARLVLRAASVFGEVFWKGGVLSLLGDGVARLDDWLDDLARREVIERRRADRFPGEESYLFRHALVRDAAYAMLPEDDRVLGHRLAGDWLERAGAEDAILLAEHFERGGERARAVGWYRRGAEQALGGNDLEGAIARAERAIACGAAGLDRGALRALQGEAHAWRGESLHAEQCSAEALTLVPRGSALWCEAAAVAIMSLLQLGHLDRFTALASELGAVEPDADAMDHYVVGSALVIAQLLTGGLYGFARTFLARLEAVAARAAPINPLALGWIGLARSYLAKYEAADPWRALACAEESAAAFRSSGDLRGTIRIELERGAALRALGCHELAEQVLRDAHASASRLGAYFLIAAAETNLAAVLAQTGRHEEARAPAEAAVAGFTRSNNRILSAVARATLAGVLLRAGDLDGALREAEAAVEAPTPPPAHASLLTTLALVLLVRGDAAAALPCAEQAMGLVRSLGSIPEGDALARLVHAEALLAAGRKDEGLAAARAARDRLLERADRIGDAATRQSFLERVEPNRRTVALAESAG